MSKLRLEYILVLLIGIPILTNLLGITSNSEELKIYAGYFAAASLGILVIYAITSTIVFRRMLDDPKGRSARINVTLDMLTNNKEFCAEFTTDDNTLNKVQSLNDSFKLESEKGIREVDRESLHDIFLRSKRDVRVFRVDSSNKE